jgi:nitrogen regulatory protein PII
MKLIAAYIRTEYAPDVIRELYKAGVGGLTAYSVYGMSDEKPAFLYSKRPFQINHLAASLKLEVVCAEESIDRIVKLIARAARKGEPGDGIIVVQDVERLVRIRDVEP